MQDQLNDADKPDISMIYILSHYWISTSGNLVVKVTRLHGIGGEAVEADDVNIDYLDTLALYLLGTCIGVKKSRKPHFSVEAKEWCAWEVKFMNAKTRGISRLVRILVTNSLEDIFGYQSALSILWPLRYNRLCLARLNKSSGKYWLHPNNGNIKYGIIVPRNAKESAQFDKDNGNSP